MAEQMLMKDGLGSSAIDRIAVGVQNAWPKFDAKGFSSKANTGIDSLELKQRVQHLIQVLNQFLPSDFEETAVILSRTPDNWDYGDPNDPIRSFAAWPIIDYAAEYGLEHPDTSLALLKQLTSLFSAEFAIRPFILRHPDLCFAEFELWVDDPDHHVRRLVSEGSRPRLPWGIRLQPFCENPDRLLPLLERLNNDSSDYVRRSVANSINDISKDNPDIAVDLCQSWMQKNNGASEDTKWIIRHAMRSLIKEGRPDVFPLLGFTAKPQLRFDDLALENDKLKLGDSLVFETQVHSNSKITQRLAIDFAIHHRKANGNLTPKVFKWKETDLKAGQSLSINKRHSIRKINTRAYYSGAHQLDLIVNGKTLSSLPFHLDCSE
mgnify:CR=1 FL=1